MRISYGIENEEKKPKIKITNTRRSIPTSGQSAMKRFDTHKDTVEEKKKSYRARINEYYTRNVIKYTQIVSLLHFYGFYFSDGW